MSKNIYRNLSPTVRAFQDAVQMWNTAWKGMQGADAEQTIEVGNRLAFWAADNGDGTFGTPVPFPGLVSSSFEPQEEISKIFADDIAWYSKFTAAGEEGEMEVLKITTPFQEHALGLEKQANGLQSYSGARKNFAFGFITTLESDSGYVTYKYTVYYNCKISAPAKETATKEEEIEANVQTISVIADTNQLVLADNGVALTKSELVRSEETMGLFDKFMEEILTPSTIATIIPPVTLTVDPTATGTVDATQTDEQLITLFSATATGGTNPVITVDQSGITWSEAGTYDVIFNAINDEGSTDSTTSTITLS